MSFDLGNRAIGFVALTIFVLAGIGILSCAGFFMLVVVKLAGLLP